MHAQFNDRLLRRLHLHLQLSLLIEYADFEAAYVCMFVVSLTIH